LFIKNSFLLFESAFSMFLLIDMVTIERSKISSKQFKATTILKRLLLLLPFIISLFIYYWFFLRHGDNPANGSGILINASTILSGVFKPVIGVLFSSLSITAIWGNFQDKASIASLYANILIAVFLLTLAIIIYRNRNKVINKCKKDEVFGMALILSLMYILFWLLFTVKQSYISNEDRLFLPVTILVLPYLISGGISASKSMKYICISLICFSLLYGVSTFIFRIRAYNKSLSIMSESPDIKGFKVFKDDNGGLNDPRNINKILADGYANNYLVIIDPEDAFLLNVTNRFIVCDIKLVPDMVGLKSLSHSEKYFMLTKHRGNVSFLNWRKIYESPRYDLYQTN
jgi:hypothetical protein